jgi:hypothetical protein
MASIKPILDSTKIALEREASTRFGAVVETFARNTLGTSFGITSSTEVPPANRGDGSFYATSYAAALAGATNYRPKLKFLFKVEFIFTPEAVAQFPEVFGGARSNDFTFMVRAVDRPKIDFEYDDDVNVYNFRTKALKKIRHRELTVTFMDDTGNRVLNFFRGLMMMHSPITRRQLLREGTTTLPDANSISSGNGMMFSSIGNSATDNAIRGVIDSAVGNVIQTIRVKQIFVDPGAQLGAATKEVIFDFINARIVSFDLDDLSHESSDVNLMTMQFDYDWMEIVDVGSLTVMDGPQYNITVPGVGGAPVDMSPFGRGGGNSGGAGSVFGNILSNQAGRAAQQITSGAITKAIQSVAGKGRFASLITSQVSNIGGGLVGAAARDIAGGVTNAASNVIGQAVNGITAQIGNTVFDSAKGRSTPVESITRSTDTLGDFIGRL